MTFRNLHKKLFPSFTYVTFLDTSAAGYVHKPVQEYLARYTNPHRDRALQVVNLTLIKVDVYLLIVLYAFMEINIFYVYLFQCHIFFYLLQKLHQILGIYHRFLASSYLYTLW